MVDPEKLRQLLGAMRPEFTNVDWTALARKVLVENPQQAWRELPGKLQASRELLSQDINRQPGQPINPQLLDQFMNLTGGFAPMGMTKPVSQAAGLLDNTMPTQSGVKQIADNLEASGLKADLYENDNLITLSRIVVPKESRNKGVGSDAMQQIIDYADATGKRVALSPSSDFGGNKERLKEFYKRFGFLENKGKNKDFAISETMYRDPR